MEQLLPLFGADSQKRHHLDFNNGWTCHTALRSDGSELPIQVIIISNGPKSIREVKNTIKSDKCIVLFVPRKTLLLRIPSSSHTAVLDNDDEFKRILYILEKYDLPGATSTIRYYAELKKIIDAIPVATEHFDNRGVFSTHYLKTRLWDDINRDISQEINAVESAVSNNGGGGQVQTIQNALGWNIKPDKDGVFRNGNASIITTTQQDIGVKTIDDVAPSYRAVAELKNRPWVILTNGIVWRLYTNQVSASTTNYFEVNLQQKDKYVIRYLVAIFGAASYLGMPPRINIFFEESQTKARALEDDMRSKMLKHNGLFLDIVKGVVDHNLRKKLTVEELNSAKKQALTILYRVWFILYAESRNLLPTRHKDYRPISMSSLRGKLDTYEADPEGTECWQDMLRLFKGIRDGDPEHNLPQYAGGLFETKHEIDHNDTMRNKFIVNALRDLFETDGEPVDYGGLGVRQLGSIYESLLEFGVRQAKYDMMLLEEKGEVREVASKAESTYSYKKNDLYLASKGGIATRKTTASFYTPDDIVTFLVRRGLEPILDARSQKISSDIQRYDKIPSDENRQICLNRLLDIQVLDPAMGSGHFLVEALNQITQWTTGILDRYPSHPLLQEIEHDRDLVLSEQKKKGISIDENLLTYDVLLKRKIMKRCIFGVDLNPLAVELTKLSLWLDSFAIGVPLTFMDHHIKNGDSTIGTLLNDIQAPKSASLDNWIDSPEQFSRFIDNTAYNADINMNQVWDSMNNYAEYQSNTRPHKVILDAMTAIKMDKDTVPKRALKDTAGYLIRLANTATGKVKNPDKDLSMTLDRINKKLDQYRFFHYELEMMDAFTDMRRGFDLIIGNPPWDKVRPNSNEFFMSMDHNYKKGSNSDKISIKKKFDKEYLQYKAVFDDKRTFYKNHGGIGENTDFDIYRIVIERMLQILAPNGVFSMIMPSAITNSRGAKALRKHILEKNVLSLYVFQNKYRIFPIHTAYRFALLTFQNSTGPDEFSCGFYLHHLSSLHDMSKERDKFRTLSKSLISKMSPEMSIIPEIKSDAQLQITQKIVTKHPKLGNAIKFSVDLGRELNMGESKDKKLLVSKGGWPVLESKNFHQYIHNYSKPTYISLCKSKLT